MKSLNEMTKNEKKEFLSMDLIERIIRLEQRVSASFGEFIKYYETHYFKSLSKEQKIKFVKYLRKYKRRKYVLAFFVSFLVIAAIIFRVSFTGNVVSDNSNILNSFLFVIFLGLLIVLLLIFTVNLLLKKRRNKRIKGYFNVIDKLYIRKVRK